MVVDAKKLIVSHYCIFFQQNKQLSHNEKDLRNYREQAVQFEVKSHLL